MTTLDRLNYVYQELLHGNLECAYEPANLQCVQQTSVELLNKNMDEITHDDIINMDLIVKMSNIVYDNSASLPLIEDGIYDMIMVRYRHLMPDSYQIGSQSIKFDKEYMGSLDSMDNMKIPVTFDDESMRGGLFYNDIKRFPPIDFNRLDQPVDRTNYIKQTKQNVIVPHKYPKLVGTLDKCKFVLNKEAIDLGCYDDPDIVIFERDFLGKHIMQGVINQYEPITLILELKYDGMSIEADVTNKIISARSRGDTNQDLAEDLSSIFANYVFPYAPEIPDNEAFGMKFEAIISKNNLYKMGVLKNKVYKNCRNGVIGLIKSSDAYAYRDLITLIPLETSLNIDPVEEIEFMNRYYHTDFYLNYKVVTGSYQEVLYQVYKFVKEAEAIRPNMPFMYDGVVVHYYDRTIRNRLGRINNVNQYSIAIKFNPMSKNAIFTGYNFTVGQNGVITPIIYHTPVEFIGTIHTKSSGHSLQRFNELNLAIGDVIEVTYRNDVMPYVTRRMVDNYTGVTHANPPVSFPLHCPSCGADIITADSGKTAYCPNYSCPGRILARITNMMKKLNIKGFAESSLEKLEVTSFTDLLSIKNTPERAIKTLGQANGTKFLIALEELNKTPIDDYRMVGALGFTNIAVETWRKILQNISINDIMNKSNADLYVMLHNIKGIGEVTTQTIISERCYFNSDLRTISLLGNVICNYHLRDKMTIRFTGCRDNELADTLNHMGYDANPEGNVTRKTDILLVPEVGHMSSKVKKIGPDTMIVAIDEFKRNMQYYLEQKKSM